MACKVALISSSSSSLNTLVPVLTKPLPSSHHVGQVPRTRKAHQLRVHANLDGGGGGGGGGELKPKEKKFITKEQEPEQYWQTAGEREGENPMMTPLPYIIIFGMSTPFVILLIAFVNGWIKVPIR